MRKPVPTEPTAKLPLTVEQYSSEKKLPLDYLTKEWGLKNVQRGGVCCVEQPYTRMDGEVCAPRYRYANAKQSPYNSGDHIILYGQKQLISPEGSTCILVEGESDTQTLHHSRYNVLGVPGTSMWDKCISNDPDIIDFLAFKTVIIIQEPPSLAEKAKGLDSAAKMVTKIKENLPLSTVVAVRLWEFAPKDSDGEPLYKDVSGLWIHYGGLPGFSRFMDALHIASRAAGKKGTEEVEWRKFFHTISELDQGEMKQLVKGFLPEGVTFLGSLSGVGKTWLALSLARALALQKPFLGVYEVTEQHNVLYLVPEMGSRALRSRAEKMGLPDDDRFRCQTLKDGVLALDSPQMLAAIDELKPVIFLDTAIRFTAGVEENSSSANASGLANAVFSLLRRGAPAVVCNHHSPKAAGDADFMTLENVLRGTGDFGAMCDAVWGVQHARKAGDKDYQQESSDLTRLSVRCVKPRDFEPVDPFIIQGRPHIDEVGDFRVIMAGDFNAQTAGNSDDTAKLTISRMVEENPQVSLKALMRATGRHNTTVKRLAGELELRQSDAGWIKSESSENAY